MAIFFPLFTLFGGPGLSAPGRLQSGQYSLRKACAHGKQAHDHVPAEINAAESGLSAPRMIKFPGQRTSFPGN
jgi:hypothetical protein